jgi:hypothetical protein
MKNAFLAALAIVLFSTQGQAAPASNEAPSLRDQIKTDRAKYKAEFENGPKERAWDRDANGIRPWNRKEAPPPKE